MAGAVHTLAADVCAPCHDRHDRRVPSLSQKETDMTVLLRVLLLSGLLLSLLLAVGQAQVRSAITSDGTLGTAVSPRGAVFNITGGTRHGPNLFHSFNLFSVGKGDMASFTSEQTGIKNIL